MSQQRESAIVRFAQIATLRMPGSLFHRVSRSKHGPGLADASPVPGLRKLKAEDGNNLIEYALTFMFFMSMVLGIVDFSRALYSYHFLSDAAREATRWAAVRGATCTNDGSCTAAASSADVIAYVTNITPPGLNLADLTTTPSWPGTGNCPGVNNNPGCPVNVTVSYQFNFVVPFIRTTPLTLSSSSEMIILH
jgi:Flp pilus assembly protein TadG